MRGFDEGRARVSPRVGGSASRITNRNDRRANRTEGDWLIRWKAVFARTLPSLSFFAYHQSSITQASIFVIISSTPLTLLDTQR